MKNLKEQQNSFNKQSKTQQVATKAYSIVAYNITKERTGCSRRASPSRNECLLWSKSSLENKKEFEDISISKRTTTHQTENMERDFLKQLIHKYEQFAWYSSALDDSIDTAAFDRVNERHYNRHGFAYESERCIKKQRFTLEKLKSISIDGSPNLIGRSVGLMTKTQ